MKVKIGDKVRVVLWQRDSDKEELTTTILEIQKNTNKALVEWEHGHTYNHSIKSWWVFIDPNKKLSGCANTGKIICKNWQRFEAENEV